RTFAQKAMALLGVQHQFGRRIAGAHEAHKQFFGLALGAAFVLLALHEQRGRVRFLDVLQRPPQAARLFAVKTGRGGHVERIGVVAAVRPPGSWLSWRASPPLALASPAEAMPSR